MIYDVSPPISESLKVWPGDTPPSRDVLSDMRDGASVTLSSVRSTVHVGAHADAPRHYGADAPSIDQRSLDYYLSRCQVIRLDPGKAARITPGAVSDPIQAERILFATNTFPDPQIFNEDFAAMSPELIDWLFERGVRLVGIDTSSVDPLSSKGLEELGERATATAVTGVKWRQNGLGGPDGPPSRFVSIPDRNYASYQAVYAKTCG